MERCVRFQSDGLSLSGVLRYPENIIDGEARPAFIVLHGFGSTKNAGNVLGPVELLEGLGYVTLRFDMRGCGESEGRPGHVICLEQVDDTRSALSFLASQPGVLPDRVALIGSSFGAAVAIYAAAVDQRVAAVISSGGWGDGRRKFRGQHPSPEGWRRFTDMLEQGRRHKSATGESMLVSRYDIVPIPAHLRGRLSEGSILEFPVETAQSMYDFSAEEIVSNISPRPLLLLHSSADSVTPTEQSIELFRRAGNPKDLHLFAETDHFMLSESNQRVRAVVSDWLQRFFPPSAANAFQVG